MTIYDLNPGDLIRIKDKSFSFLKPVMDKDIPIHHLKIYDSCPSAEIIFENGREYDGVKDVVTYPVSPDELLLVKHFDSSDKRWCWIANRKGIGDNYTIYESPIAKNPRYKYMWQRLEGDWYVCPFCKKKLNKRTTLEDIPCWFDRQKNYKDPEVKECDCEGWKKQEKKYESLLKAEARVEKLKKELTAGTDLDEYIVPYTEEGK